MLVYLGRQERHPYGRVVELVDSLDSGSSVHCGRAGSSPASPTKETVERLSLFIYQHFNQNGVDDFLVIPSHNKSGCFLGSDVIYYSSNLIPTCEKLAFFVRAISAKVSIPFAPNREKGLILCCFCIFF